MTIEEWDMRLQGLTREEWLARKRRARRRERLQAAGEAVGVIFVLAMYAMIAWLFLAVTPDDDFHPEVLDGQGQNERSRQ